MINFYTFLTISLSVMSSSLLAALEYSKIEHPGCPENSFCSIETGKTKTQWQELIQQLNSSKNTLSIKGINQQIISSTGFPISGWAKEEAQILPNIIMWDSPCKNHKIEIGQYYISDFFTKKIDAQFLKDYSNLYFPKAYIVNSKKELSSQIISREDLPSFISNRGLHYLKSDEGKYYGLIIGKDGALEISDIKEFTSQNSKDRIFTMHESICTKEQIDLFKSESPNTAFYDGYYCKNIWNISTKNFDNVLFGRSCD